MSKEERVQRSIRRQYRWKKEQKSVKKKAGSLTTYIGDICAMGLSEFNGRRKRHQNNNRGLAEYSKEKEKKVLCESWGNY